MGNRIKMQQTCEKNMHIFLPEYSKVPLINMASCKPSPPPVLLVELLEADCLHVPSSIHHCSHPISCGPMGPAVQSNCFSSLILGYLEKGAQILSVCRGRAATGTPTWAWWRTPAASRTASPTTEARCCRARAPRPSSQPSLPKLTRS